MWTPSVAGWIEPDGDESALAIFDPEGLSATSLRGGLLFIVHLYYMSMCLFVCLCVYRSILSICTQRQTNKHIDI